MRSLISDRFCDCAPSDARGVESKNDRVRHETLEEKKK